MADFAYTTVPGKIKPLLQKIREVGVPPKVTGQWLKTVGFTSSNDATLIGVLKQVGLIDGSSAPTARWTQYRGATHKRVLGDAIQAGYAELFAVYPDAWQRSQTDLEHVFSTTSSGGKQVITKTVATFKNLAEAAEFTPVAQQTELTIHTGPLHTPPGSPPASSSTGAATSRTPSIHIDIQLHISPEASADQIDQIFKSMSKHLYGGAKSE